MTGKAKAAIATAAGGLAAAIAAGFGLESTVAGGVAVLVTAVVGGFLGRVVETIPEE